MKHKIVAVFCAIVMIFSVMAFAACDFSGGNANTPGGEVTNPETPGGDTNTPGGDTDTPGGDTDPNQDVKSAKLLRQVLKSVSTDFKSADVKFSGSYEILVYDTDSRNNGINKYKRADIGEISAEGSVHKNANTVSLDVAARNDATYGYYSSYYDSWNDSTDPKTLVEESDNLFEFNDAYYYVVDGFGYSQSQDGEFEYYGNGYDLLRYSGEPYSVISNFLCKDVGEYSANIKDVFGVDLLNGDWTIDSLIDNIVDGLTDMTFTEMFDTAYEWNLLDEDNYEHFKELFAVNDSLIGNMKVGAIFDIVDKLFGAYDASVDSDGMVDSVKDKFVSELKNALESMFTVTATSTDNGHLLEIVIDNEGMIALADKWIADIESLIEKYGEKHESYSGNVYIEMNITNAEFFKDYLDIDIKSIFNSVKKAVSGTMTLDDLAKLAEDALAGTGIDRNSVAKIITLLPGKTEKEVLETIDKYKDYSLNAFIKDITGNEYDYASFVLYVEEHIDEWLGESCEYANYVLQEIYYLHDSYGKYWNSESFATYKNLCKNLNFKISATFDSDYNLQKITGIADTEEHVTGGTSTEINGDIKYNGGIYIAPSEYDWYPNGSIKCAGSFTIENFGSAAPLNAPDFIENFQSIRITDSFSYQAILQNRTLPLHYDLGYYDDIELSDRKGTVSGSTNNGHSEQTFSASLDEANSIITIPALNTDLKFTGIKSITVYVDLYKAGRLINDDYPFEIQYWNNYDANEDIKFNYDIPSEYLSEMNDLELEVSKNGTNIYGYIHSDIETNHFEIGSFYGGGEDIFGIRIDNNIYTLSTELSDLISIDKQLQSVTLDREKLIAAVKIAYAEYCADNGITPPDEYEIGNYLGVEIFLKLTNVNGDYIDYIYTKD